MKKSCHILLVFFALFLNSLCGYAQTKFYVSPAAGLSALHNIQNGIPPYFYEVKSGSALSLGVGASFLNSRKYKPTVEAEFEQLTFSMRHFSHIIDSSRRISAEDMHNIKYQLLTLKLLVGRNFFKERLLVSSGLKLSTVLNKREEINNYVVTSGDNTNSILANSNSSNINVRDVVFPQLYLQMLLHLTNQLQVGGDYSYALYFERSDFDNDFLGRNMIFKARILYSFSLGKK